MAQLCQPVALPTQGEKQLGTEGVTHTGAVSTEGCASATGKQNAGPSPSWHTAPVARQVGCAAPNL